MNIKAVSPCCGKAVWAREEHSKQKCRQIPDGDDSLPADNARAFSVCSPMDCWVTGVVVGGAILLPNKCMRKYRLGTDEGIGVGSSSREASETSQCVTAVQEACTLGVHHGF